MLRYCSTGQPVDMQGVVRQYIRDYVGVVVSTHHRTLNTFVHHYHYDHARHKVYVVVLFRAHQRFAQGRRKVHNVGGTCSLTTFTITHVRDDTYPQAGVVNHAGKFIQERKL